MPKLELGNATSSNYSSVNDVTVDSQKVDSPTDQKETIWMNDKWPQQWAYLNELPELRAGFLQKAKWVVGKGYTADPRTTVILDHIKGWGKETFLDVLFNGEVIKRAGGNAYSEIVWDDSGMIPLNIKPLNPEYMRHVVGPKGDLIRFEQISSVKGAKPRKFSLKNIFYLAHNRLADQTHGTGDIDSLELTINADNESFKDIKKLAHHQGRPFILWKLKTDDDATINALVAKIDKARNLGDDMFIPDDDDAISYEIVQVNPSSMLLDWRRDIRDRFFRSIGTPQSIFGTSGATESGGKIESLGHDQTWQWDQGQLEKQVWQQLHLKIDLIHPASIAPDLAADEAKDAGQGLEIQPSDTTAGVGR